MKKTIYLLSVLFLFVCAGCGSAEPEEYGETGCQAFLKDKNGVTEKCYAVFFLFEGTGFIGIDENTFTATPAQKVQAIKSNGTRVENIGWCTSTKESSGLMVPVYSATDKDRMEKVHSGTFTIACATTYNGVYGAYMMKEFTKKRSEPLRVNANFYYTDFTQLYHSVKVPWR